MITWGKCGHPLRDAGNCRVCAMVKPSDSTMRWMASALGRTPEENHRRGVEEAVALGQWHGREAEAMQQAPWSSVEVVGLGSREAPGNPVGRARETTTTRAGPGF